MTSSRYLIIALSFSFFASTGIAQVRFGLSLEVAVSDPAPVATIGDDAAITALTNSFVEVWTSATELRATRVSQNGTKLDSFGVPISSGKIEPPHSRPTLIFNGRTVVAFWNYFGVVYATEFTPDLQIVQQDRAIANVGGYTPTVAWDGQRYLILAGSHRIVLNGNLDVVLDSLRVDSTLTDEQLASDGTTFVLVGATTSAGTWQIIAEQLLPDGTPNGDRVLLDGDVGSEYYRWNASISGSTSGYFVAWNRGSLELGRLEAAPLRIVGRAERPTSGGGESIAPAVTWVGSDGVVTWSTQDDPSNPSSNASILSAAFSGQGLEFSGAPNRVAAVQWDLSRTLSIAGLYRSAFITWRNGLYAMARSADGVGDPILVSAASTTQTSPQVALTATAAEATWSETPTVVSARVTPSGHLDGFGTALGAGWTAAVASDGNDFLVAEIQSSAIVARVIRADGHSESPIDLAPVSAGPQMSIEEAWDGTEYVIAWNESQRIVIVRLNRDGGILARHEIAVTTTGPSLASLSCGDATCTVAWVAGVRPNAVIEAARLDRYSVIDQNPVQVATLSDQIDKLFVAGNGDQALIAWTGVASVNDLLPTATNIRAVQMVEGVPSQTLTIGVGGTPRALGLQRLGTRFVLLWAEWGYSALLLTSIDSNGVADPKSTTKLADESSILWTAALGTSLGERVSIVYQRQTTDTTFGSSQRVFYREAFVLHPKTRAVRH